MSCPKNIQKHKFLFWNWTSEGAHDMYILCIGKFMHCSENFEVSKRCSICGTVKTWHFVETEELLREGISIEDLNAITPYNTLYPKLIK